MNNGKLIKKFKIESGTSLIELLVAITLFAFMIIVATQIFKMVIDGQRNALSAQNVQENIRYAMEKISKEIRMAKISNDDCLDGAINKVFNTMGTDSSILYFKNQYGNCVYYFLEIGTGGNNRLYVMTRTGDGGGWLSTDPVTPANINVRNLKFYIVDDLIDAFHSTQPYVTIMIDVEAIGLAIHKQSMKIQMTVSSRYYE